MKKITAIILIFVVALSLMLTACTQKATTTPEETTTTTTEADLNEETSEVEIKEWAWNDEFEKEELVSPEGVKFNLASFVDGGYRFIIKAHKSRCLFMSGSSIWLAESEHGTMFCLSKNQIVVDYTVAGENIYWLNLDKEVWTANWRKGICTPKLFCEDAIDVSPFKDESQGAVVPPERANWNYSYGGIPIYSPYGE